MTNPWIEHVKKFASKKGMSYRDALKDPNVKKGYKKKTGGATYGVQDSPRTPNDDDYIDPRFHAKDGEEPEMKQITETMRRVNVSARRPQREQEQMRIRPPSQPPAGRRIINAKKPSVQDPKRIKTRADFLKGWIEVSMDEDIVPRRSGLMLIEEIDDILMDKDSSFSDKMDDLLEVEKSLRVFIDEGEQPSALPF